MEIVFLEIIQIFRILNLKKIGGWDFVYDSGAKDVKAEFKMFKL
jgi:hypothetical protein